MSGQVLDVDGLEFTFPDRWTAAKVDEWAYYRRHFQGMRPKLKAVDVLARDDGQDLWLIEVKDYRRPGTPSPRQLGTAIADKVLHTLAMLLPAACNAANTDEQDIARAALLARRIRVVAHVEQPSHVSRLFPAVVYPADLAMDLGRRLRAVCRRPLVVDAEAGRVAWTVQ